MPASRFGRSVLGIAQRYVFGRSVIEDHSISVPILWYKANRLRQGRGSGCRRRSTGEQTQ
jgi:hypothetical protein